MLSAKKYLGFVIVASLLIIFFVVPAYVYLSKTNKVPQSEGYLYKFNEITSEGYPAVIDFIKKEAGYEDTGTSKLSSERNFITNSQAWSFKLDEQFITVFLFDTSEAAQASFKGFSLKGFKYVDPITKESARLLWEHTPDFFLKENVLVIYSGQSKEIGRIIDKHMGDSLAVPVL